LSKTIVAIQTAKAECLPLPNKTLSEVQGHPAFAHSIIAAHGSEHIDCIYCSTDDSKIMELSELYEYELILRPSHLSSRNSSHHEVIKHAVTEIEKEIKQKVDVVVLLQGTTTGVDSKMLDYAIEKLTPEYDSVINTSNDFDKAFSIIDRDVVFQTVNGPCPWLGKRVCKL
jgi:CMP-N-acetylneuraminic acid synthetase